MKKTINKHIDTKHLLIRLAILIIVPVGTFLAMPVFAIVFVIFLELFVIMLFLIIETIILSLKHKNEKRNANLILLLTPFSLIAFVFMFKCICFIFGIT